MKKETLAALSIEELKIEVVQLKKELFNLKLNASAMHLKDYSQFRKSRVAIGRALTYKKQKELALQAQQSVTH